MASTLEVFYVCGYLQAFSVPQFARSQHLRPSLIFDKVALPGTGFAGFPYQRTQAFDVRCAKKELGFSAQHDLLSSFKAASAWVSSN